MQGKCKGTRKLIVWVSALLNEYVLYFQVKMLKHGKIPFKMSLRADIQKGQLLLIKPAKDNLDHTALQQDQSK